MKILIVSWYFPPCSTMGALRVGKFAKYLVSQGHDVRIVCARDQPYAMDHPVEVPADIIHYTRWRDVNWFPAAIQACRVWLTGRIGKTARAGRGSDSGAGPGNKAARPSESPGTSGFLRSVLNFYRHVSNVPDGMIGWLFPALRGARAATRDWAPDIVFASAPPFTTLIAGRLIAGRLGAPLVVEYRDRWWEDSYAELPKPRRWLDRKIEEWCVRPARAIVTVSEPWAADYVARWGKPVAVAYNGFDPDDMVPLEGRPAARNDKLTILYTGIIYPERRDPTPLLTALTLLGEDRNRISLVFHGSNVDILAPVVAGMNHQKLVSLRPGVPFAEALRLQRDADVLLLLQWNNPLEAGNVPGKLFEYLAARRPVLGIGYEEGVPARLLRERGAGQVLNDPEAIAVYLRELMARKDRDGGIELLPETVSAGLSRPEQYGSIESLFERIVAGEIAAE